MRISLSTLLCAICLAVSSVAWGVQPPPMPLDAALVETITEKLFDVYDKDKDEGLTATELAGVIVGWKKAIDSRPYKEKARKDAAVVQIKKLVPEYDKLVDKKGDLAKPPDTKVLLNSEGKLLADKDGDSKVTLEEFQAFALNTVEAGGGLDVVRKPAGPVGVAGLPAFVPPAFAPPADKEDDEKKREREQNKEKKDKEHKEKLAEIEREQKEAKEREEDLKRKLAAQEKKDQQLERQLLLEQQRLLQHQQALAQLIAQRERDLAEQRLAEQQAKAQAEQKAKQLAEQKAKALEEASKPKPPQGPGRQPVVPNGSGGEVRMPVVQPVKQPQPQPQPRPPVNVRPPSPPPPSPPVVRPPAPRQPVKPVDPPKVEPRGNAGPGKVPAKGR